MSKFKKYVPHATAVAVGVVIGLTLATTSIGVKLVSKISGLRAKAGV